MLCRQIGFVSHGIRDAHRGESVSAVNALRFLMLLQIPFRPYPANGQWKDLQSNTPLIEMAVVGPMRRGEGRSRAIGSRSHPSVGIPRPGKIRPWVPRTCRDRPRTPTRVRCEPSLASVARTPPRVPPSHGSPRRPGTFPCLHLKQMEHISNSELDGIRVRSQE